MKLFLIIISCIVSASNHTKCISLRNQQCTTQATVINLHPNEYTQGLRYFSFAVNLDRCTGSCKILLIIYLIEYVFQTKQKI